MDRLRCLMRVLHIAIVVSLVLQLSAAGLARPATALAAGLVQIAEPESAVLQILQSGLDLTVRQAVAASDWQVVTLRSQLDSSALQAEGLQLTGTGTWHVEVLDEAAQPLTLEGRLTFGLEVQGNSGMATQMGNKLTGTLQGPNTEVALDHAASINIDAGSPKQTTMLNLRLTRGGQVSQIAVRSSGETRSIEYGMTQYVAQSTFDRNGTMAQSISVLTVRDLGQGESEAWLRIDNTGTTSAGGKPIVEQHWFQRFDGRLVNQYLVRFDLNTVSKSYSLQQAAMVRGTLGSTPSYDLTLADESGNTLNLKSGPAQEIQNSGVKGLQLSTRPMVENNVHYQPQGRDWTYWAGIAVIVVGLLAIFGVALVEAGLLTGVLSAAWGLAELTPMASGGVVMTTSAAAAAGAPTWATVYTLSGVSTAGLAGTAGLALMNPDPYFVIPDVRPMGGSTDASPVRITRVSGGLVAPQTALAAQTAGTAGSSPSGAQVASGPAFDTYNDRPGAFVGGSIPAGAQAMGGWSWDAARPFGAIPSHTGPPTTGTQRHYFVHAAEPLLLGADDNIIQYVYPDPQQPPAEILLQFYVGEGDGEHRAYWGADRIQTGGTPGTPALLPLGALPTPGGWMRLQIPAEQVGLAGQAVTGILYGAYGGQTWWGPTTTSSRLTDNAAAVLPVDQPPALPATEPGAQIAFRAAQAMRLNADILDETGAPVRTLLQDKEIQPGYQVLTWDGKDAQGQPAADKPYRVRLSTGGQVLAEAGLTISPLIARIQTPGPFSLVRGTDVPVIGEAYGAQFKRYVVDYGEGLAPTEWTTVNSTTAPTLQPAAQESLRLFNPGNLANWNVGLDEYDPWKLSGLNGAYRLRLRTIGADGREAVDSVPVIVGRLAYLAEGGTIPSPDGKARLVVPPLAVHEPFALMALVPATDSDPNGPWRGSWSPDMVLAGEVYEIFPANETFRRPATLELPYDTGQPADKVGLWLGDGTPGGWRYVGGYADSQKGIITVPLMDFPETRALAAPFVVEQPGLAQSGPAPARLAFDAAAAAPWVAGTTAPVAFYSDLESGPGEYEALDVLGTNLRRVKGAEAGLSTDDAVLKVTRLNDGVRLVRVCGTPYDAVQYPILSFDYRIPPNYVPNLLVRSNGTWWQLLLSRADPAGNYTPSAHFWAVSTPPLTADDTWRHCQLDLLAWLRASQPEATSFQVDEIVLGQVESTGYLQYALVDQGAVGSAYYVDNFAALAPTRAKDLVFSLTPPSGAAFGEYSLAFDQQKDTSPPETPQVNSAQVKLSAPDGVPDGMWYLHARGHSVDGTWSIPSHFPVLIDRQPPAIAQPSPPPGGAGSPDVILVPLRDVESGLDTRTIKLQLNDMDLTMGQGLRYQPETSALQLMPNYLSPTPPSIANGQPVRLSLLEATDYAGNKLAQPVSWTFTADRPKATAQSFHRLTVAGGDSPAISPDGSLVAFASDRSGTEEVWVMRSDDYEEQTQSARPLTSGAARESDPAWSPDGLWLAFISDASGSPQLWVSAPDGSSSRPLTQLDGNVLSPTWSPDGRTVAFVYNGNLWAIGSDGSNLRALTHYVEQPLRAVSWQPGGNTLAVAFKLYQETIQLYDVATGELTPLTHGGKETQPAWLNANTVLFTAPVAPGEPEAVWQINLDGSGETILAGSGEPDSSDMAPAAADQGATVALTSTRGGQRDVWLRAVLQVARFDVSPATGAAPGEMVQITYALPADADVTLQVLGPDGSVRRALLDATRQVKGAQTLSWDGTGSGGNPLAPGDYTVKLSALTGGGEEPLIRFATARLLDKTEAGILQLQINQWANQPLTDVGSLQAQVYPEGQRARPIAQADYNAAPSFSLPVGRYDIVVSYGTARQDVNGVAVGANGTISQAVDLRLGGLEVILQNAPGSPAGGAVNVQVVRSDDPQRVPLSVKYTTPSTFVLPVGQYDVLADLHGVKKVVSRVDVQAAQVSRCEISVGAGLLRLNVLALGEEPANPVNGLMVQAFNPQDHQNPIATDYNNPAQLNLPEGRYDVQVQHGVSSQSLNVSGRIEDWFQGVDIRSGETLEREHKLRVGRVKLDVLEAAGKPADPNTLNFDVYRQGDRANPAVTALFVNSATVLLAEGSYEVWVSVSGTELRRSGPVATFEVQSNQDITQSINLKLGRFQITVADAPGQLTDGLRLNAVAYPTGNPESLFATASSSNPLMLPVLAGTQYDLVIRLDGKQALLPGQSVQEGDMLAIQLNAVDFR